MAFSIHVGQQLQITVNWTNTGSEAHAFDVLAYLRNHASPNEAVKYFQIALDVPSATGATVNTPIILAPPMNQVDRGKTYDVVILLGDFVQDVNGKWIVDSPVDQYEELSAIIVV